MSLRYTNVKMGMLEKIGPTKVLFARCQKCTEDKVFGLLNEKNDYTSFKYMAFSFPFFEINM